MMVMIVLVCTVVPPVYIVMIDLRRWERGVVGVVRWGGSDQTDVTPMGGTLHPWPYPDWTYKLPVH